MEICIRSHMEAWQMVRDKPKHFNVVYICDPDKAFYGNSREIVTLAKSALICVFHDIEHPVPGKQAPVPEMVLKCVEFAERKSDIIVTCPGGISRSAALAYVMGSVKFYSAESALKLLDVDKHIPNFLIIQHAAEMLKKPDLIGFIRRFREGVFAKLS